MSMLAHRPTHFVRLPCRGHPEPQKQNQHRTESMKKKGGKPKTDKLRTISIGFRTTPEEAEEIKKRADIYSLRPGVYARIKSLEGRLPSTKKIPEINRQQYNDLGKLSSNLNQIAKACNQGFISKVNGTELLIELNKIKDLLNSIRINISGVKHDSQSS